jgi:hypothetical protein
MEFTTESGILKSDPIEEGSYACLKVGSACPEMSELATWSCGLRASSTERHRRYEIAAASLRPRTSGFSTAYAVAHKPHAGLPASALLSNSWHLEGKLAAPQASILSHRRKCSRTVLLNLDLAGKAEQPVDDRRADNF